MANPYISLSLSLLPRLMANSLFSLSLSPLLRALMAVAEDNYGDAIRWSDAVLHIDPNNTAAANNRLGLIDLIALCHLYA